MTLSTQSSRSGNFLGYGIVLGVVLAFSVAMYGMDIHAGGPPFAGNVKTAEGLAVSDATVYFCYDAASFPLPSCTPTYTEKTIIRGQWGSPSVPALGYFRFWAERGGVQTPSLTFRSRCGDCSAYAGDLIFTSLPPTPELDFSYLGWEYAAGSSGFAGSPVNITAMVRNEGAAPAGSFALQLRIDANHDGAWDAEPSLVSFTSLASGAEEKKTWNAVWTTIAGWHRAFVCVDATDTVRELDDQDNCVNVRFTVTNPVDLSSIPDGALIRSTGDLDVYIVKYAGAKKYKRLILSPHVFASYRHLRWEDIREVSPAVRDAFVTSSLVRATGDSRVWSLYAWPFDGGDAGIKSWIPTHYWFTIHGLDWDAIYEINAIDRDAYQTGLEYGEG